MDLWASPILDLRASGATRSQEPDKQLKHGGREAHVDLGQGLRLNGGKGTLTLPQVIVPPTPRAWGLGGLSVHLPL